LADEQKARDVVTAWGAELDRTESEWLSVTAAARTPESVTGFWTELDRVLAEERQLRRQREWVSGPDDLLHIARAADDELLHSNVIAWLLTADGRHQLGDRLLRDLLAEGWPGAVPDTLHAVVEREVVRGPRRADIIVTMGPVSLVIENKMWSDESEMQCQDLYDMWLDHAPDVRFLLLSPDGRLPRTAKSDDAVAAWRAISYGSLASWLEAAIDGAPMSLARLSAEQYVASLRKLVPDQVPFKVTSRGGRLSG